MEGSEKLIPLVIGKFKKPRCFRTVTSLPVNYDWYFLKFNRKVVFIMDNYAAHCEISNLRSIKLIFMPTNVTSVLQPLDQGIIQNVM